MTKHVAVFMGKEKAQAMMPALFLIFPTG